MKHTLRMKLHKLLSLFLAVVMLLSLVNVSVLAEEEPEVVYHEHNLDGWTCQETKTLICEQAEHVHTPECYGEPDENSVLVCGLEETEGHQHTEECDPQETSELTCELAETEGHTHTEECYTTDTELVCGLEETEGHTHIDNKLGEEGCYTWTPVYAESDGPGIEEAGGGLSHTTKRP